MKVQVYSQWMEEVYVPVRVKQLTKAAKLMGCQGFGAYKGEAQDKATHETERLAASKWLVGDAAEVSCAAAF